MIHGFGLLRRGALLGVLACLAAVGLGIPATAAAKVTSLTSCGTIADPGTYRLDADVSGPFTGLCFRVAASNVTLSLNGHTITMNDLGSNGGIGVGGSNVHIVGPGTVTGGHVVNIDLVGGNGSVRGVTVENSLGAGIQVASSDDNDIRGNVATGNAEGIEVFNGTGSSATGNTIIGNSATGNRFGIEVSATGNTITGNYAQNNGTDLDDTNGNCTSNVWRGNTFGTANPSCIQ